MNKNPNDTVQQIKHLASMLKLPNIACYEKHISNEDSFKKNLMNLLYIEYNTKERQRIERRVKYAGFPVSKTLDTFDKNRFEFLKPAVIDDVATCKFIEETKNCIAISNSGMGKTHLSIAVGYCAIQKGYSVKFRSASDLINQLREAQNKKTLCRYLKILTKCDLLILDEVGYLPYTSKECNLLFQVLAGRYERKSTFVTSNLVFSDWIKFLGNQTLATAIVDRLIHNSIILNMNGDSYRIKDNKKNANDLFDKKELI